MRAAWVQLTALAAVSVLVAGCTGTSGEEGTGPGSSSGGSVTVAVSGSRELRMALPGVATVVGPRGSFSGRGRITVTPVRVESAVPGVRTAGSGIDVEVVGAELIKPLRVSFVVTTKGDADDVPVVLHHEETGTWQAELARQTSDRITIETTEFSPRLPGWLDPRTWFGDLLDSAVDALTARTDPPPCPGRAPKWASLRNRTTMLHTCLTANQEPNDGAMRAEAQLSPNRRFYVWVTFPQGADYTWAQHQPMWLRSGLARLFRFESTERVLLHGETLATAGYRQPTAATTKTFDSYIDAKSVALSSFAEVIGLTGLEPKNAMAALALLAAQCSDEIPSSVTDADGVFGLIRCGVTAGLENLADPDKALAAAMEHFGEAAFTREAEPALRSMQGRLQLLGKVLKVIGVAKVARDVWAQVPDAFSQIGADRPGEVSMTLRGRFAQVGETAALEADPEIFLRGFLDAYRRGDSIALAAYATATALSDWQAKPPVGTRLKLHWQEYCRLGSSGAGGCGISWTSQYGGGWFWYISYREIDGAGHLQIYQITSRGGGA